ncbi:MAG TPA: carboxypeptidase regulatory-like domain-containing protein [Haliangiales bacterium]|nr:carboxypeptidase regulatory-like domain-containing protein [Haliangiales bacterium]
MSKRALVVVLGVMAAIAAGYVLFVKKKSEAPAEKDTTAQKKVPPPQTPAPGGGAAGPDKRAEGRPLDVRVAEDDDPPGKLRLEGQVIDDEERPVGGAVVLLGSRPRRTAKTEADGSFAFDQLVGRSYFVAARKDDAVAGPVTVRVTAKTEPVTLRLKGAATLEVTVIAADTRKPLAGADVTIGAEEGGSTAPTGADGKARLRGVGAGWHTIEASAEGYARGVTLYEASGKAGATEKTTVELKRGAPVSGTVVDAAGKPVAGARVAPLDASSPWVGSLERTSVDSDAKGKFAFAALPAGTFRFEARHPQHAPGTSSPVTLDGKNARADVVVRLAPAARIAGRVVSKAGQPVGGATLRVAAKAAGYRWDVTRQAYADDRGQFDIGGLPRAVVQVAAIHETAASSTVDIDLAAKPEQTGLTITLDLEGTIAGMVVTPEGEAISDAQVLATPEATGSGQELSSLRLRGFVQDITDAGGRFELTGLAPGTYRLRASRSNDVRGAWLRESVPAKPGDRDVKLVLQPDGKVKGRVLYDDGSAPSVYSVSTGWGDGTPFSDPGGAFALDSPAGPTSVTVSGPEFVRKTVSGVTVKANAETDVGTITVERGRSISGRVLHGDGSPAPGAKVVCGAQIIGTGSELSAGLFGAGLGVKSTTSDDDGGFTLSGVGVKSVVIAAEHPTDGRSGTVRLPASPQSASVDLVLRPFAPLEGRVTTGGNPVAHGIVTAGAQQASRGTFIVQTGDDGGYRFDKLAPDTYMVTAMEAGGMMGGRNMFSKLVTVGEQGARLDIELPSGNVSVSVAIAPPSGVTVSAAQVFLVTGHMPAVSNAEQFTEAFAERGEGALHPGFVLKGKPAKFDTVVPGPYSACAIPLPGDINSPADLMKLRDKADQLPVACIVATIRPSPAEQSVTVPVPAPPAL